MSFVISMHSERKNVKDGHERGKGKGEKTDTKKRKRTSNTNLSFFFLFFFLSSRRIKVVRPSFVKLVSLSKRNNLNAIKDTGYLRFVSFSRYRLRSIHRSTYNRCVYHARNLRILCSSTIFRNGKKKKEKKKKKKKKKRIFAREKPIFFPPFLVSHNSQFEELVHPVDELLSLSILVLQRENFQDR